MKKVIAIALVLLSFSSLLAEPLDFIALLDVSESMLPFFEDTANYLIRDTLGQSLANGDGFHLLSFADTPEVELIREIDTERDVESALQHLLLLQPLGRYTDLISALRYVFTYTSQIRGESAKKILILTDGIHDPPPGSPYAGADIDVSGIVAEIARDIRAAGWEVSLIKFPAPESEEIGRETTKDDGQDGKEQEKDVYEELSQALDEKVTVITDPESGLEHQIVRELKLAFPKDVGTIGYRFSLAIEVSNESDEKATPHLSGILWKGIDILERSVSVTVRPGRTRRLLARIVLPAATAQGPLLLDLETFFEDEYRIHPRKAEISAELRGARPEERIINKNVLKVLGIVGLSLVGLGLLALLVLAIRRLILKAIQTSGSVPSSRRSSKPGERPIELRVEGQNPNIGFRNISTVRDGGSKTVGGSSMSGFLVYLFPFPRKTAEISRKGNSYTFTPVKDRHFLDPAPVENCLGKEITLLTLDDRRVSIRFTRYVSALERINRIMHLTDEPGPHSEEI